MGGEPTDRAHGQRREVLSGQRRGLSRAIRESPLHTDIREEKPVAGTRRLTSSGALEASVAGRSSSAAQHSPAAADDERSCRKDRRDACPLPPLVISPSGVATILER